MQLALSRNLPHGMKLRWDRVEQQRGDDAILEAIMSADRRSHQDSLATLDDIQQLPVSRTGKTQGEKVVVESYDWIGQAERHP